MIPKTRLRDFLADRRRAPVSDQRARNQFFVRYLPISFIIGTDTTNTITINELLRVRSVQISAADADSAGFRIAANGQQLFDDALLPETGGPIIEAKHLRTIPAGSTISATHFTSTGAPSGTVIVLINVEPFEILPQPDDITLTGGDRLHVPLRDEARQLDAVRRSTIRVATDQTEAGRAQVEQVRGRVGRNARSLIYPNRYAFRGGQRAR